MTQTLTQNPRHKTPIFNRDELHKTFAGTIGEIEFDTQTPLWMSNYAGRIESCRRFDYMCGRCDVNRTRMEQYRLERLLSEV